LQNPKSLYIAVKIVTEIQKLSTMENDQKSENYQTFPCLYFNLKKNGKMGNYLNFLTSVNKMYKSKVRTANVSCVFNLKSHNVFIPCTARQTNS